jgi:hypothetical protein
VLHQSRLVTATWSGWGCAFNSCARCGHQNERRNNCR